MEHNAQRAQKEDIMAKNTQRSRYSTSRRSLLLKGLAVGGAGALGAGLLTNGVPAFAKERSSGITRGDVAILRFLAAIEILETDLWQQYNELGGIPDSEVPGGTASAPYVNALQQLDGDMSQYIHDNTEDEISHFTFINAFLASIGADPVNLDHFRNIPSSKATGARQIGRLTNLMELTVDTSWWTRYRSRNKNPDFGDTFAQAIPGLSKGRFPAIPRNDGDLAPADHIQAIANTAGFHFGFIEQGGSSLYPTLAQGVTNLEVLRVLLSIGPVETAHFQTWHDKAGNAKILTDPTNGLVFPDLNNPPFGGEDFQTNLIMPEPTIFLSRDLPAVSIIRPTRQGVGGTGGAVATVKAWTADGLFINQRDPEFFAVLSELAVQADEARRGSALPEPAWPSIQRSNYPHAELDEMPGGQMPAVDHLARLS
ncbi:MAG: hypothetical protein AUG54_05930 [Ktedonobacter sp. 13_1_20CM_4_53_7]|nr:MAG: hypothetical protein AUG54_05930 [Ktedonobacter sp. 13_1_20CM_4_53_7]